MFPADFEQRVANAQMLWLSRMRRWRFTFAAVAASHTLERFTNMNKPPLKETLLSHSLMRHAQQSLKDGDSGKESPVEHALKTLSENDKALCMQIAQRGVEMGQQIGVVIDLQLAAMDIAVIHTTAQPLKLWQFLASDADDFAHDFTAIGRFIDRRAGVLTGGVRLRFAEKKQ